MEREEDKRKSRVGLLLPFPFISCIFISSCNIVLCGVDAALKLATMISLIFCFAEKIFNMVSAFGIKIFRNINDCKNSSL